MKTYYYDMHIHSVLSPCADVLMTPNNILNMANLKGLDIIAVCDHNSLWQLPVLAEISASYPILFIFGAEIEIQDGSHVLVYLKALKDVNLFCSRLEPVLNKTTSTTINLHPSILTDINDLEVTTIEYNLSQTLPISLDELAQMLEGLEHRLVLAHVDRINTPGIAHMAHPAIDAVECSLTCPDEWIIQNIPSNLKVLFNSDAHEIVDISERSSRNQIELSEKSFDAFFEAIHRG